MEAINTAENANVTEETTFPVSSDDNQTQKKKIAFISGRIRGLDPIGVSNKFMEKQASLEAQGYEVYNPVKIIEGINNERYLQGLPILMDTDPLQRAQIMKLTISIMACSDEVHLLHDWQESEGATKEVTVAKLIPMPVIYP